MGDRLQPGKPSWYVASHPGQLSLAIPPCVGAMSTSESWDVNRHAARCTSPVSVVWQCKLVSGWGLMKRRSAPPLWLGKDFTFSTDKVRLLEQHKLQRNSTFAVSQLKDSNPRSQSNTSISSFSAQQLQAIGRRLLQLLRFSFCKKFSISKPIRTIYGSDLVLQYTA